MSVDYASNPADLPEGTLVDLFYEAVDRAGEGAALRFHAEGGWRDISHAEVLEEVRRVAGALADLGCKRGDRAAILSENRPEWALADYGCLTAGVVDIPVYATLTAGQIGYILKDGGARLVFLSDACQLAKMQEIRDDCPELDWVVVFDPPATLPEGTLSWSDFL
ncbi:MAG: AMP-binding protein, partial [Gemmatimonadota bacterium]